MKEISEKQKNAIYKLAGATKTEVENVEGMSSFEASKVITALIEKMNTLKQSGGSDRSGGVKARSDYKSDALAGLAVKILAQRHDVKSIIAQKDRFKQRAVELYKVFDEARHACLA